MTGLGGWPGTVGVLHPGQMGAAVAAQLTVRSSVLWCPTGRSRASTVRAELAGLEPVNDLGELLHRADLVLSICPPAGAEVLANTVARHHFRGVYIDANAISPARMLRIARTVQAAGAEVVDGAIFGPPPTGSTTARLYLAGLPELTTRTAGLFANTTVEPVAVASEIGAASGLKIAHSSYQKASRALAGVAHALAADLGVTEHLLAEAHRNATSPLADPDYLPSVAARAWRWVPEMLEVAETLAAAGLPPHLASAAATVLDQWTADKDTTLNLEQTLTHLRRSVL